MLVKGRALYLAIGCAGMAFLAGCAKDPDSEGDRAEVSGKVTFADGKPLTRGTVIYSPNVSKGNSSKHEPRGQIDSEGNYKAITSAVREGVLPGHYKVTIVADEDMDPKDMYKRPASLINRKYNTATTSGLTIEVIKNPEPGRYDFKVTK